MSETHDWKGRKLRPRPTHFMAEIVAHEAKFTTRRIACGLAAGSTATWTEDKALVTCKRCQRSPDFDPALYRGRW